MSHMAARHGVLALRKAVDDCQKKLRVLQFDNRLLHEITEKLSKKRRT